ncbi:hypothetical protein [Methylobacterium ajmalii]|uniref:hypothetical protein n=1 Tax=Methylobacterium ajmalii TaxID=2738439 RepID=UPI00190B3840|nr:hypothetical protein [Methylobacterium ajmalii]MBK3398113.1 hypothetical protein [Methylobacterium ajmalii]MBK3406855.1 hypothetical protein [Methylobacterium ajmalii]MBK3420654.1 hypothetical protein [Methylobacterium ajmalii]MBZ6415746.1 hypothetical protein [Methylobacterium sp.]
MLTPAQRLAAFLAAIVEAIARFFRRLLGIAGEAGSMLAADAKTAWSGVTAVNDGVGAALDFAVAKPGLALARGLGGAALATAKGVGAVLGAALPQRPASPSQVASQVAAADSARTRNDSPAYSPPPSAARLQDLSLAALVRRYAADGLRKGAAMKVATLHAQRPLPPEAMAWLESLDQPARMRVAIAAPDAIERHLSARSPADLLPGVPRCPSPVDVKASLAAAKAAFRVEQAAIAAGTAPAPAEPAPRPGRKPFSGLEDVDLGVVAYSR